VISEEKQSEQLNRMVLVKVSQELEVKMSAFEPHYLEQ
jgi:hypothetical protein